MNGHGHQMMRWRRGIVRAVLVTFSLTPLFLAGALYVGLSSPMMVISWGFDSGPRYLTPLRQRTQPKRVEIRDPSRLGRLLVLMMGPAATLDGQFVRHNWTGSELYVDGVCGACGKPWAPPGSFVLARLPSGFYVFTHDGNPQHQHMSPPKHVPAWAIWGCAGLLSFLLVLICLSGFPIRQIRRRFAVPSGHCRACGYNLHGLSEPRCPECGQSFEMRQTHGAEQLDQ